MTTDLVDDFGRLVTSMPPGRIHKFLLGNVIDENDHHHPVSVAGSLLRNVS